MIDPSSIITQVQRDNKFEYDSKNVNNNDDEEENTNYTNDGHESFPVLANGLGDSSDQNVNKTVSSAAQPQQQLSPSSRKSFGRMVRTICCCFGNKTRTGSSSAPNRDGNDSTSGSNASATATGHVQNRNSSTIINKRIGNGDLAHDSLVNNYGRQNATSRTDDDGGGNNDDDNDGVLIVNSIQQPLLGPKSNRDANKKCLIIDLDETLVHSSFKPINNADYVVPVEIDGTKHQVYVLKRPYVDEFLKRMGDLYECVLFTASLAKYADPVADLLDSNRIFRARLFRDSCVFHNGNYVKDLNKLGRKLRKVIIVDNSPVSYLFHPNNAVPVSSWFDDLADTELKDLIPFFEKLSKIDNVYKVLCNTKHPYNMMYLSGSGNKSPTESNNNSKSSGASSNNSIGGSDESLSSTASQSLPPSTLVHQQPSSTSSTIISESRSLPIPVVAAASSSTSVAQPQLSVSS